MPELLLAGDDRVVRRQVDSPVTGIGAWVTQRINRLDPLVDATIQRVQIFYQAIENTEITLAGSSDGGRTFSKVVVVRLPKTGRVRKGKVSTWLDMTGRDLRIMLIFPESDLIVYHLLPTVVYRGLHILTDVQ